MYTNQDFQKYFVELKEALAKVLGRDFTEKEEFLMEFRFKLLCDDVFKIVDESTEQGGAATNTEPDWDESLAKLIALHRRHP